MIPLARKVRRSWNRCAVRLRTGAEGPALLTFVLGAALGALTFTPLYSVEIAQAVSGVVPLPLQVPISLHHFRVFSLVIEVPALLLRLGASDLALCRIFSMLMGGTAFAAVSLGAFALSRNRWLALTAPVFLMNVYLPGHKYPVVFPTGEDDAGVLGMSAALLAISLLVLRVRAGAVLLGLLPAIHATWAVAAWLVAIVGFAGDRRRLRALRRGWRYLAFGLGLAAVTWVAHEIRRPLPVPTPPQVADMYTRAVVRYWSHMSPISAKLSPLKLARLFAVDAGFLVLAIAAFTRFRSRRRFLLTGLMALMAIAVLATLADEFSPGWAPLPVHALMANRWLNLNTIVFVVLALAILLRKIEVHWWAAGAAIAGLGSLAIIGQAVSANSTAHWFPAGHALLQLLQLSHLPEGSRAHPWLAELSFWSGIAFLTALAAVIVARSMPRAALRAAPERSSAGFSFMFVAITTTAAFLHGMAIGGDSWGSDQEKLLLQGVAARPGTLLTAPGVIAWPQLRTRRPVLLDTLLIDALPYAPDASPGVEEVLNKVYDVTLLSPMGIDQFANVQRLWETRSPAEWNRLGESFAVTDVLVPADWTLQLPRVEISDALALYRIPTPPARSARESPAW